MPKIAFVINSLTNGGAERTVSNLSLNLPSTYEIDIILNDVTNVGYSYRGNLISLNMKPRKNKLKLGYQIIAFIIRWKKLRHLKSEKRYDAVISFSESANIANILSGNRYCKTIVSVRVNLSSTSNNKMYKYIGFPLVRLFYNMADVVVAVSEGVRQDLIANFRINSQKIITIPNGCDIKKIEAMCSEKLTEQEKEILAIENVIITIGRLEYQKGQWYLIRALSELKRKGLDFKLCILGVGGEERYYRELVKQLGLEDDIYFCGFYNNPFKLLYRAKLYVLPSLFEGMGNTLIEALACKIPCISTDHRSGAREILAPNTDVNYTNIDHIEYAEYGVIVPNFDGKKYSAIEPLTSEEKLLAVAIYEMIFDEEKRNDYKLKAKKRTQDFNLENCIYEWMRLVES